MDDPQHPDHEQDQNQNQEFSKTSLVNFAGLWKSKDTFINIDVRGQCRQRGAQAYFIGFKNGRFQIPVDFALSKKDDISAVWLHTKNGSTARWERLSPLFENLSEFEGKWNVWEDDTLQNCLEVTHSGEVSSFVPKMDGFALEYRQQKYFTSSGRYLDENVSTRGRLVWVENARREIWTRIEDIPQGLSVTIDFEGNWLNIRDNVMYSITRTEFGYECRDAQQRAEILYFNDQKWIFGSDYYLSRVEKESLFFSEMNAAEIVDKDDEKRDGGGEGNSQICWIRDVGGERKPSLQMLTKTIEYYDHIEQDFEIHPDTGEVVSLDPEGHSSSQGLRDGWKVASVNGISCHPRLLQYILETEGDKGAVNIEFSHLDERDDQKHLSQEDPLPLEGQVDLNEFKESDGSEIWRYTVVFVSGVVARQSPDFSDIVFDATSQKHVILPCGSEVHVTKVQGSWVHCENGYWVPIRKGDIEILQFAGVISKTPKLQEQPKRQEQSHVTTASITQCAGLLLFGVAIAGFVAGIIWLQVLFKQSWWTAVGVACFVVFLLFMSVVEFLFVRKRRKYSRSFDVALGVSFCFLQTGVFLNIQQGDDSTLRAILNTVCVIVLAFLAILYLRKRVPRMQHVNPEIPAKYNAGPIVWCLVIMAQFWIAWITFSSSAGLAVDIGVFLIFSCSIVTAYFANLGLVMTAVIGIVGITYLGWNIKVGGNVAILFILHMVEVAFIVFFDEPSNPFGYISWLNIRLYWINFSSFVLLCTALVFQICAAVLHWPLSFFGHGHWENGACSAVFIGYLLYMPSALMRVSHPRALFTPIFMSFGLVFIDFQSYPLWYVGLMAIGVFSIRGQHFTRAQYWFGDPLLHEVQEEPVKPSQDPDIERLGVEEESKFDEIEDMAPSTPKDNYSELPMNVEKNIKQSPVSEPDEPEVITSDKVLIILGLAINAVIISYLALHGDISELTGLGVVGIRVVVLAMFLCLGCVTIYIDVRRFFGYKQYLPNLWPKGAGMSVVVFVTALGFSGFAVGSKNANWFLAILTLCCIVVGIFHFLAYRAEEQKEYFDFVAVLSRLSVLAAICFHFFICSNCTYSVEFSVLTFILYLCSLERRGDFLERAVLSRWSGASFSWLNYLRVSYLLTMVWFNISSRTTEAEANQTIAVLFSIVVSFIEVACGHTSVSVASLITICCIFLGVEPTGQYMAPILLVCFFPFLWLFATKIAKNERDPHIAVKGVCTSLCVIIMIAVLFTLSPVVPRDYVIIGILIAACFIYFLVYIGLEVYDYINKYRSDNDISPNDLHSTFLAARVGNNDDEMEMDPESQSLDISEPNDVEGAVHCSWIEKYDITVSQGALIAPLVLVLPLSTSDIIQGMVPYIVLFFALLHLMYRGYLVRRCSNVQVHCLAFMSAITFIFVCLVQVSCFTRLHIGSDGSCMDVQLSVGIGALIWSVMVMLSNILAGINSKSHTQIEISAISGIVFLLGTWMLTVPTKGLLPLIVGSIIALCALYVSAGVIVSLILIWNSIAFGISLFLFGVEFVYPLLLIEGVAIMLCTIVGFSVWRFVKKRKGLHSELVALTWLLIGAALITFPSRASHLNLGTSVIFPVVLYLACAVQLGVAFKKEDGERGDEQKNLVNEKDIRSAIGMLGIIGGIICFSSFSEFQLASKLEIPAALWLVTAVLTGTPSVIAYFKPGSPFQTNTQLQVFSGISLALGSWMLVIVTRGIFPLVVGILFATWALYYHMKLVAISFVWICVAFGYTLYSPLSGDAVNIYLGILGVATFIFAVIIYLIWIHFPEKIEADRVSEIVFGICCLVASALAFPQFGILVTLGLGSSAIYKTWSHDEERKDVKLVRRHFGMSCFVVTLIRTPLWGWTMFTAEDVLTYMGAFALAAGIVYGIACFFAEKYPVDGLLKWFSALCVFIGCWLLMYPSYGIFTFASGLLVSGVCLYFHSKLIALMPIWVIAAAHVTGAFYTLVVWQALGIACLVLLTVGFLAWTLHREYKPSIWADVLWILYSTFSAAFISYGLFSFSHISFAISLWLLGSIEIGFGFKRNALEQLSNDEQLIFQTLRNRRRFIGLVLLTVGLILVAVDFDMSIAVKAILLVIGSLIVMVILTLHFYKTIEKLCGRVFEEGDEVDARQNEVVVNR